MPKIVLKDACRANHGLIALAPMYKLLIPLFALAILIGCTPAPQDSIETYGTSSSQPAAMAASSRNTAPADTLTGTHTVTMKTSKGDITIELYADKAPKTVTNFVRLAEDGYYDDLTFHRVIPDFMIQGGDPTGTGAGGESIYGETFEDEDNDLPMVRGMLAMANRGPDTNGSQFFIIQAAETPWLQGRHTVFGKVVKGIEVVDAITKVQRDSRDKPVTPVTFSVEVEAK